MNTHLTLLTTLLVCLVLSGCASTSTLNRELVHKEKIKTVKVNRMEQNINIQQADSTTTGAVAGGLIGVLISSAVDSSSNEKRQTALEPFIEMLVGLDVNKILKNALEHTLSGGSAFVEDVDVNVNYGEGIASPFLTPIVTPKVIMLANYSGVRADLHVSTSQGNNGKKQNKFVSVYSSKQLMDTTSLAKREQNKQFWKDNPVLLREKIVNALYDATKQFADDFNKP